MRRILLPLLAIGLAGCQPGGQGDWFGWHDQKRATDQEVERALNGQERADYPAAIAALRASDRPASVKDLQVGDMIVSGHGFAGSLVPPRESIVDGIVLLERAATGSGEGAQLAPSRLAGIFTRGAGKPGGQRLEPDAALASCWTRVKAGEERAATCIAQRRESSR